MSTSLSLSFELICLMGWLLKNEKTTLNALVKQAIKNGLAKDLSEINPEEYAKISGQLYTTILDFLVYLEEALAHNLDSTKNSTHEKTTPETIFPPSKKRSGSNVDHSMLKISMKQTKAELEKEMQKKAASLDPDHAKKLLYEHIIKNWKPSKNELMN